MTRRLIVILLILFLLVPAPAVATSTVEEDQLTSVDAVPLNDEDGDGAASAFEVTIQADTSLDDTDTIGNNPGEPYFEVEIDGDDLKRTDQVERSETYSTSITLTEEDLSHLIQGNHELTVQLWDKDGDNFDDTDLGNDDLLDEQTLSISYEQPSTLEIESSRPTTIVGSPVSLRLKNPFDGTVEWDVVNSPAGSAPQLNAFDYENAVTFRPDESGQYTIRARSASRSDDREATVDITVSADSNLQLLKKYAPNIHYDEDTVYLPTRYEAFVNNARLEEFGSEDEDSPTMFNLAGRPEGWELDLKGGTDDYPTYDDNFPTTVYGSVHENVQFEGETYTAVTYWFFYIYDPKKDDSIAALLAHQSDLETVTILLQDGSPKWVGASQHYGGELREWSKASTDGTHLDLYPAVGAHSNYLRNTENYDDSGIPIQEQFIDKLSTDTSLVDLASLTYVDVTGDDIVLANDGSGDTQYQIVPLTGDEIWATYRGSFGPDDDAGKVPFARARWNDPGDWMATTLVPDEEQVDGSLKAARLSLGPEKIEGTVEVFNEGPKPHPIWIVIEAKPSTVSWDSPLAVSLYQKPVFVGVGETKSVTVASDPPDDNGVWNFRVRLTAYPPSILDAVDILDVAVSDKTLSIGTPTPTNTPTSTPSANETTDSVDSADDSTSETTESRPNSEDKTEAVPTQTPGFGISAALIALLIGLLCGCRYRHV